jgi:hypothetical protein
VRGTDSLAGRGYELRQEQKETVGLNEGGRPITGVSETPVSKPTLASQGIDKNLAKEMRALGALSEGQFEEAVALARDTPHGSDARSGS